MLLLTELHSIWHIASKKSANVLEAQRIRDAVLFVLLHALNNHFMYCVYYENYTFHQFMLIYI